MEFMRSLSLRFLFFFVIVVVVDISSVVHAVTHSFLQFIIFFTFADFTGILFIDMKICWNSFHRISHFTLYCHRHCKIEKAISIEILFVTRFDWKSQISCEQINDFTCAIDIDNFIINSMFLKLNENELRITFDYSLIFRFILKSFWSCVHSEKWNYRFWHNRRKRWIRFKMMLG